MGLSLGLDRRPVVSVVGDGAFLYSPQALWTAAREDLPVLVVILNNQGYLILRRFLAEMGGRAAATGLFVGMDIADPAVDLVQLARSFGVQACSLGRVEEIGDAVRGALSAGRPSVIELRVAAPATG
jgi:benzoylformate decarboxylase